MKTSSALPVRCYAKAELAMLYFPAATLLGVDGYYDKMRDLIKK